MRTDIRVAGLPAQVESRIRLAAQLIAAFDIDAKVSAWDGTRCHALVADVEDAYGARSIELAARRGIAVLALSDSGKAGPDQACKVERGQPAGSLAKVLVQCLSRRAGAVALDTEQVSVASPTADSSGLVQLASVPALGQGDVVGRIDGLSVLLRREASRASAASREALLAARDRLAQPGWEFSLAANESPDTLRALGGAGMALDAFCVSGARASDIAFPSLPARAVQLQDWPDLGAASVPPVWLSMVGMLQRKPRTPSELVMRSGAGLEEVHALLWALQASGAIVPCAEETAEIRPVVAEASVSAARSIAPGLLSKLMRRFGFVAASAA